MGYWQQDDEGHSFAESETDPGMVWGDTPADIIGDAIDLIKASFIKDVGRLPTRGEVIAGLQFTTRVLSGLPETVREAEAKGNEVLKDWFEGEPDGYHREAASDPGKEFERAYYGVTDPATTITDQFLSSAFRGVQREHWKTLVKVIKSLEVEEVDDDPTSLAVVDGG